LTSIAPLFGFAPTKVKLYKANHIDKESSEIEEIQTKGVCTKRLIDFGFQDNTTVFI
jgi:hypothetical protein